MVEDVVAESEVVESVVEESEVAESVVVEGAERFPVKRVMGISVWVIIMTSYLIKEQARRRRHGELKVLNFDENP